MNFYRRPLPSICISFSSHDGIKLFKQAMSNGEMENYFRLASQLRTQNEPAFCGLATLVMVLNALEIDPGRIWKGPWRWYHEEMLDCCIPMETVKLKGITMDQFTCIAKCNGLTANITRVLPTTSIVDFEQIVRNISTQHEKVLVVSYSRQMLGQTGDGHFAAIGGYHVNEKMVLLFDTARFKYPPHWVPLNLLWNAMGQVDAESGMPRGYIVLSRDTDSSCQLLLATSVELNHLLLSSDEQKSTSIESSQYSAFINDWNQWLSEEHDNSNAKGMSDLQVVNNACRWLLDRLLHLSISFPLTCHSNFSNDVNPELEAAMSAIIRGVLESPIGMEVSKTIINSYCTKVDELSTKTFRLPKLYGCSLLMLQDDVAKITFLVSSWLIILAPLKSDLITRSLPEKHSRLETLQKLSGEIVFTRLSLQSQMELVQMANKLVKMYACYDKSSCNSDRLCCAMRV